MKSSLILGQISWRKKKAGAVMLIKITGRVDTFEGSGFKLCFFMRQVLGVSLKDSGNLLS